MTPCVFLCVVPFFINLSIVAREIKTQSCTSQIKTSYLDNQLHDVPNLLYFLKRFPFSYVVVECYTPVFLKNIFLENGNLMINFIHHAIFVNMFD